MTLIEMIYDKFNTMSDADFKSWMLNTDLVEKEKQQIIDAHINGQYEFDEGKRRQYNDVLALHYYLRIKTK
jgi:hypothetical protein